MPSRIKGDEVWWVIVLEEYGVTLSRAVLTSRKPTHRPATNPPHPSSRGEKRRGVLNSDTVILSSATACVPLREGSVHLRIRFFAKEAQNDVSDVALTDTVILSSATACVPLREVSVHLRIRFFAKEAQNDVSVRLNPEKNTRGRLRNLFEHDELIYDCFSPL